MNRQKLEEINLRLQKENQKVAIDGITNYNDFSKVDPKILWILKEPNQSGSPHADDMREFHKDVTRYPRWKRTYKVIIQTTYAILNNCTYDEIPHVDQIYNILNKIAFVNVKKIGGGSSSPQYVINKAYFNNKSIILDQIDYISPDIIINGSKVWALFQDLPGHDYQIVENFNVKSTNGQIFIYAYHPNQRKINQRKYIDLIRQCIAHFGIQH